MKKRVSFCLVIMLSMVMMGCKEETVSTSNVNTVQQNTVENLLEEKTKETTVPTATPTPEEVKSEETATVSEELVDIDLTLMSSTMVYSEVFNMVSEPDKYVGKTIRMRGQFSDYYDETNKKYYAGCIIADATACCAQGIEFVLKDDPNYEDERLIAGNEITVVGTFDYYIEGRFLYTVLNDAHLE